MASTMKYPNTSKPDPTNARILAEDVTQSNDTWITGLNNNDLIIGPTGAGKTRGYVIPNLIHSSGESFIVVDTKGNLCQTYGTYLRSLGYKIQILDFIDCIHSAHGYDPLALIAKNSHTGSYLEQDIIRISTAICPVQTIVNDPYWEQAAQMLLSSLIALTLERFAEEDRNMSTVCRLATMLGSSYLNDLFEDLETSDPDSFAVKRYHMSNINKDADKMVSSVRGILVNALQPLSFDGATHLFKNRNRIDIAELGRTKTVLFLNISDNDRSLDRLVNTFYTQAIQELIREADRQECNALPVPVRIIFDDFASNTLIPDFDKIITTIRSRNIAVSLIIQDLSQLDVLYKGNAANVIRNNCDTWLYLGGRDVGTAHQLSELLNITPFSVLNLGLDESFLIVRGHAPKRVKRYDLSSDRTYQAIASGTKRTDAEPSTESTPEELVVQIA